MAYEMKPLSCNPTKLKGLSEKLIVSHHENNYGGAVKRLNAIARVIGAPAMSGAGLVSQQPVCCRVSRAVADAARCCRRGPSRRPRQPSNPRAAW